jgi:phosphinothricin acetyltransferase
MEAWFRAKAERNDPCIGVEDGDGRLLGYATYGVFRGWPAYKYTVELSIHLAPEARGQGLGPKLLARLIDTARDRGVHVMVAGIDASNATSIAVHERLGFRLAGTVRQCGFKFGRWLDLALYQLILPSPAHPVDG